MGNWIILLLLLLSSVIPSVIIFFLAQRREFLRNFLNITGIFFKLLLVSYLLYGLHLGLEFRLEYEIFEGINFSLRADRLSMLFVTLSSVLWLFTTVYAIAYLQKSLNKSLFFGFFSLCVSATVGLALAGNLFTFFIFYELLTLTTFSLILHERTHEAKQAAITYLKYTVFGGTSFLLGLVLLYSMNLPHTFVSGGYLQHAQHLSDMKAWLIFIILLLGVGVKAALFGLHGWLPKAMAAPAPVSALLHAVAVVKAGAFGIIRIVYDIYGIQLASSLGLLLFLATIAAITIIYGSIKALGQTNLKKRLAYSTVSQVSYITLGVALYGPLGTIGGIVHLVHQGVMKITLFFCAGAFAKTAGVSTIDQTDGLGKTMPLSAFAFSIGAFGMIGLPPFAGFVSKYYLSLGALANDSLALLCVLGASALLNGAYFLPIVYRMWFLPPKTKPIATKSILFALGDFSALTWVKQIAQSEYGS